ncbi:Ham1 family protein [Ilyonectria robusta]
MAPKQLNFITGNRNKLSVVKAILGDTVSLQSQSLDLVEIQGTIEEISVDKCRRAADAIKGPVLVEDTCLCFHALKELPGPYIKWFFAKLGHEGLNNLLAAYPDKSAQAVCTFAYCEGPGHEPVIFQGRIDGKIVSARGPTNAGIRYSSTRGRHMPRWTRQKKTRSHILPEHWIS